MSDEVIDALNQITAIVDEKAAKYKNEVRDMPRARALAEKQMIIKLIDDGLNLAGQVQPKPADLISDLGRLRDQLTNMA